MNRSAHCWPLRVHLRDPIDSIAISRMWQRIEAQEKAHRLGTKSVFYSIAAAAGLFLFGWFGVHLWHATTARGLVTESGAPFVQLLAPPQAARTQRFADGSTIHAEPGTIVEGLSSNAQEFSVLLARGTIDVFVVPGGPRRWIVEAKVARLEVVGTRFTVARRDDDEVTIAVDEGVVLVRSAALPQGIERLVAGRSLRIPPPTTTAQPPTLPAASTGSTSVATSTDAMLPPPDAVLEASESPSLPSVASAARTASSPSNSKMRLSASGLMQQADRARVAGDTAQAERLLTRLVREFPGDSQAAIAAYTLAVVRSQRGKSQAAVDALRLALALRPPSSVQQDCYLRLVEGELATGQRERAVETAREYHQKFPNGRYRRAIAAQLQAPRDPSAP